MKKKGNKNIHTPRHKVIHNPIKNAYCASAHTLILTTFVIGILKSAVFIA